MIVHAGETVLGAECGIAALIFLQVNLFASMATAMLPMLRKTNHAEPS